MFLKDAPIQKKLMIVILLISGSVSFLTCVVFFIYETLTFRQTTLDQMATLTEIIASNSTAALAFRSEADAYEILRALKAETHVLSACLYDDEGEIFAKYPLNVPDSEFPADIQRDGVFFANNFLEGYQSVIEGDLKLGTVFIRSDLEAFYQRSLLYGSVALLVIAISFLLSYLLSKSMRKAITKPILSLAKTAKEVSEKSDYSVRAKKFSDDEVGFLTRAFNKMLAEIQQRNQEIEALNLNLEQKVRERTQKLEAANKELDAFSYSISHDLRAPLRIINGYTNVFLEDYASKMNDDAKEVANVILRNTQHMGRLIDDLLEFSRLGRKEIVKSKIHMKELVDSVWEETRSQEKERQIEFLVTELPFAYADYASLRQVWVNLISNAIKYTRKQANPVIKIGCEKGEDKIVYYIHDNGSGFDMKYYNKLFGVFQRLHSPTEFEGTGVGLAIVQRVINRHGGNIWAESEPDKGTTFYFTLG